LVSSWLKGGGGFQTKTEIAAVLDTFKQKITPAKLAPLTICSNPILPGISGSRHQLRIYQQLVNTEAQFL
jgi:hypothetical protein